MKKVFRVLTGILMGVLVITGCGAVQLPESIEDTTLIVDGNGAVTSYLVEDFSKEYYDVTELKDMAAADVAVYNEEHPVSGGVALGLGKVEKLGTANVLVEHLCMDAKTFEDYIGYECFFGTVSEALMEGYDLDCSFTSVKDGSLVLQAQVKNPEKTYILITDFPAVIYGPHKVTHVSEGGTYRADGGVDATAAEGKVIILMK